MEKIVASLSKAQKKIILSDPLSVYRNAHPQATSQEIEALKELWKSFRVFKQQLIGVKEDGRRISRLIGEAKRNGNPVDALKADMQACSREVKIIRGRLGEIENQILDIVSPGKEAAEAESDSMFITDARFYRGCRVTEENVDIALLENDLEAWDAYVEANPSASIYHRSVWKDIIEKTFGHQGIYLTALNSKKKVLGILPLVHLKSRLFGNFMVSMPYFNYGGAIGDTPSIEHQLMSAAQGYAEECGVSHIEYRDDISREGLKVRSDKVNMILGLPEDQELLWSSFGSKLRAQIRKSMRDDTQILFGSAEYLDDFYAVFSRNMRDLGTPVYAKSFFRSILNRFPGNSKIGIIRLNKRPVAAGFLIGFKDTLEIPWASTIKDVNHLSINMLLYWEILKYAIKEEYHNFDFGRSSMNSGTFNFKKQWGAKPRQIHIHYWLRDNCELPALHPNNPKYALAIYGWKRLPLIVANKLGPSIVKNLP